MQTMNINKIIFSFATAALLFTTNSCTKEYQNNNAPEERDLLKSPDGLIPLIVGLKSRWSSGGFSAVYNSINCAGLSTGELAVLNSGNADLATLVNGNTNLTPNNGNVYNLWACCNNVLSESNKVIVNAPNVADVPTRNAIQSWGHFFKAIAIGTMCQFWEKTVTTTGANVAFKPRTDALQEAATLLDQAVALLNTTPIPANINSRIGTEFDLKNSCLALAARYYNMLGQSQLAINRVNNISNLNQKNGFAYDATFPNPIYRISLTTANVVGVRTNLGLSGALLPEATDARVAFYTTQNATRGSGHFLSDLNNIPVWQQGEMLLVKAESFARINRLDSATFFIDKVRTKTAGQDIFSVGAGLAAYAGANTQQALLDEIYKQRCIELYMSGLKLEDSRRFGRPAPISGTLGSGERNRNYYPYPQQERDGNTNTPADPPL
jgi:starch-binding outer membrane protein, SusD/RagB family